MCWYVSIKLYKKPSKLLLHSSLWYSFTLMKVSGQCIIVREHVLSAVFPLRDAGYLVGQKLKLLTIIPSEPSL